MSDLAAAQTEAEVRRVLDEQARFDATQCGIHELQGRLALVRAYAARLADVNAVLQGYDYSLGTALAQLGAGTAAADGSGAPSTSVSSRQLEAELLRWEHAVAQAAPAGTLHLDQMLQDCSSHCSLPPDMPVPAADVLALLAGGVQADLEEVKTWGQQRRARSASPSVAASAAEASSDSVAAAISALQRTHISRYADCRALAVQERDLRAQLAAAQAASKAAAEGLGAATLHTLAAQQAGLTAALQEAERQAARLAAQAAAADGLDSGGGAAALARQVDEAKQLQRREQQFDGWISALCAADLELMRAWRQGSWDARAFIEDSLVGLRQPALAELATKLPDALAAELAAFQAMHWPSSSDQQQPISSSNGGGQGSERSSKEEEDAVKTAAGLLDPLAAQKTREHAAELLATAAAELEQLRPVRDKWREAVAAAEAHAAELQAAAAELEGQLAELQVEASSEGSSSMRQLAEAEAAAAQGLAAVADMRTALKEWWACPALHAVPWVKHDGKSAGEWLRLLEEQREALARRAALGAYNGSRVA